MTAFRPLARSENLIVQPLGDELMVYDPLQHQAIVLNRTAAAVWNACDGASGAAEIATRVAKVLDSPVDAAVVWYSVAELSKKGLLEERAVLPAEYMRLTRRDFLRRAGAIGMAVALPAVIAVAAPHAAQAASCVGFGGTCVFGSECCSSACIAGICGPDPRDCKADGQPCDSPFECCSYTCDTNQCGPI